ncbi:hypothetical protein RAS1_39050 [Phycisphaerae bacterium RAS1]|nr:hypothetical protein RAS1_39050 [Phycisphaerae bacterium RAS1]
MNALYRALICFSGAAFASSIGSPSARGETLRVYLSAEGWDTARPAPQPVPQQTDPVFPVGPSRVYVWAQALTGNDLTTWLGLDFQVELPPDAVITGIAGFNPTFSGGGPPLVRWTIAQVSGGHFLLFAAFSQHYGLRRVPYADGFVSDAVPGSHVLLGYLDISSPSGGEVWLEFGPDGGFFCPAPGSHTVEFGFGDPPLPANAPGGTRSASPDAYIVGASAPGACCLKPLGCNCELLSDADCATAGGLFLGAGTSCVGNCPGGPTELRCILGECIFVPECVGGPPCPCANQTPGDANCDDSVNVLDINAFVLSISDPVAYLSQFSCLENCDVNLDGSIDVLDINPFIALLSAG